MGQPWKFHLRKRRRSLRFWGWKEQQRRLLRPEASENEETNKGCGQERFHVNSVVPTKPYLVTQVTWLEDRPSPSTVNGDGTAYMASADESIKVSRREGEAKGHKFDGCGGAGLDGGDGIGLFSVGDGKGGEMNFLNNLDNKNDVTLMY